jgi:hypothetical protein
MYSWSNLLEDKLTQWLIHAFRKAREQGYKGEMRKAPVNRLIACLRQISLSWGGRSIGALT